MTFSDYREPSLRLFSQLRILRLEDVVTLNLCLFMHDWCNHKLPDAFDNFFHNNESNVPTRSSVVPKLLLPTKRTEKYGTNNIKYKGSVCYNQNNESLLSSQTNKNTLKNRLTTLLLAAYT